jgi:hypothetical protein
MITRSLFGAAGVAAAGLAAALALAASAPAAAHDPAAEARAEEAGERLGARIQAALRAEGPFFTAEERSVIERACGYPPGSWDGFEANMSDGVFVCSDGRRVDSPEVRAVMEAAGPRIGRRVSAVMGSPEVRGEIERVSREATRAALAAVDHAAIAREAMAEARVAIESARREAERASRDADGKRRGRRR